MRSFLDIQDYLLGFAVAIAAMAGGVFLARFAEPPSDVRLLCVNGRQYVQYQRPRPGLGLVLTRNGSGSAIARCGQGTPADLVEDVKSLHESLAKIMAIEDGEDEIEP
jgi:hypothetical protein